MMQRFFYKNGVPTSYSPLQVSEGMAKDLEEVQDTLLQDILAEKVSEVPNSVSKAQGKSSLIRSGLWQGVVDFVNSISDPVEKAVAEVALNDTTHWQRTSPFLNEAANALGLTDEQLDQLFIEASKIEL